MKDKLTICTALDPYDFYFGVAAGNMAFVPVHTGCHWVLKHLLCCQTSVFSSFIVSTFPGLLLPWGKWGWGWVWFGPRR